MQKLKPIYSVEEELKSNLTLKTLYDMIACERKARHKHQDRIEKTVEEIKEALCQKK